MIITELLTNSNSWIYKFSPAGWCFVLVGLYWLTHIFIGLIFDKMNDIPGPYYAKFTNLIESYYRLRGTQFFYYQYLHNKYGDVVRVAPNRVIFKDSPSVKEIYATYTYTKGPIYQIFTPFGENLFSSASKTFHASRKKLLSKTFSTSSIAKMEPLVFSKVEGLVRKMKEMETKQDNKPKANLYKEIHFLTFDIIAQLVFAKEFNLLKYEDHPLIKWLKKITVFAVLDGLFKISKIYTPECKAELRNFILTSIHERKERLLHGEQESDILSYFIMARDEKGEGLTDQQLLAETLTQLIAGSDTTCNSLTWCIYLTLKHPEVQAKVESEIRKAFNNLSDINFVSCKKNMIYTEAVIQESMRLFPVSSGLLARTVPQGGAKLAGYYVPEDAEVGASFYCYHRNPDLWDKPDKFIPDRWLSSNSSIARSTSLPFLIGPRGCIGRELGWMEMYLSLAALFLKFDMSLNPTMDESIMDPEYYLVLRPSGSNLPIVFKSRT